MSDIDTVVVNSLKALDPEWPIREADIEGIEISQCTGPQAGIRRSEKQHQGNEDRRNAENEDEPVHGNQDADRCGEASGLPGCECAAPPTRVMNSRCLMGLTSKARDHDLIITPRIAARSGHLCPLRVQTVWKRADLVK